MGVACDVQAAPSSGSSKYLFINCLHLMWWLKSGLKLSIYKRAGCPKEKYSKLRASNENWIWKIRPAYVESSISFRFPGQPLPELFTKRIQGANSEFTFRLTEVRDYCTSLTSGCTSFTWSFSYGRSVRFIIQIEESWRQRD